jgi:hypothetical protein
MNKHYSFGLYNQKLFSNLALKFQTEELVPLHNSQATKCTKLLVIRYLPYITF